MLRAMRTVWLAGLVGVSACVAPRVLGPSAANSSDSNSGNSTGDSSAASSGNSSNSSGNSSNSSGNSGASSANSSNASGASSNNSSASSGQSSGQSAQSSDASKASSNSSNQSSHNSQGSSDANSSSRATSDNTTNNQNLQHSSVAAAGSALLTTTGVAIGLIVYFVGRAQRNPPAEKLNDAAKPAQAWLRANQRQLRQDLALGAGPTLEDLAAAAEVPRAHYAHFARLLASHRDDLLSPLKGSDVTLQAAVDVLSRIGAWALADAVLHEDAERALTRHEHDT